MVSNKFSVLCLIIVLIVGSVYSQSADFKHFRRRNGQGRQPPPSRLVQKRVGLVGRPDDRDVIRPSPSRVIHNWESYKVKRQNHAGTGNRRAQVLPPIRRNERVEGGNQPSYYPIDSAEKKFMPTPLPPLLEAAKTTTTLSPDRITSVYFPPPRDYATTPRSPWRTSVRTTTSPKYTNRRDGTFYESNANLNTKYFQINNGLRRPIRSSIRPTLATTTTTTTTSTTTSTTASLATHSRSRIPVLVKKLAKRPLSKVAAPKVVSVQVVRRNGLPYNNTDSFRRKVKKAIKPGDDICDNGFIECGVFNKTRDVRLEDDEDVQESSILSFLPSSFEPLVDVLRGELWVVPVLVASACLSLILIIFEIYLLVQALRERRNHRPASRRHLFLGQTLLFGLLMCTGMSVMYTLKPTVIVCSVIRVGTSLAYVLVYATLLVKLVFLVSLNSGVYLPATYQSLLLCFAILIQVVIGVQWLISSPAKVAFIDDVQASAFSLANETMNATTTSEELKDSSDIESLAVAYATCNITFHSEMLGMLYVVFLVIVVIVLAFKARGVRENYREAMYIGLAMGFAVCIMIVWVLAGLMTEKRYSDVCVSCGLIATSGIIFVVMFMPKGRQLSAMGREGVYAEDRTDVYTGGTGSSTQSTGSGRSGHLFGEFGGTLSPSFFPIKPPEKLVQQFRDGVFDEQTAAEIMTSKRGQRERLATPPPPSPRKHRSTGKFVTDGHFFIKNFPSLA